MPTKRITKKTLARKPVLKRVSKAAVTKAPKLQAETKEKTGGSLQATVVGLDGKASGKVSLPKELFGAQKNSALMAQALRVFQTNQRQGNASTKTRGEVEGSTRKIYRQKGTGKARHGAIRAPIFVGGGIVFGPKPKSYHLVLSKKMREKAVLSALSLRFKQGNIKIISGMANIEPKTKVLAGILKINQLFGKILLIVDGKSKNVIRAAQNLDEVMLRDIQSLNTYELLLPRQVVFMQEALLLLKERYIKGNK